MTRQAHLRSILALTLAVCALPAQDQTPGQRAYDTRCGRCHGGDGRGSDMAPSILRALGTLDDKQLAGIIRNGIPGKMPSIPNIKDDELQPLMAHARLLRARMRQRPVVRETVMLNDGRKIEGEVVGEGFTDKQIRAAGKVHLLRRLPDGKYREVTSSVDWPGYNGDPRGNRYTTMTQITKENVRSMTAKWVFPVPNGSRMQGTPVVVGGLMYITNVNQLWALDAGTGRQVWHWQRPTTPGTVGASSNRGVAVVGDRVFISTDHAHLVALNRFTGEEIWDVETADYRQNYFATGAPLAVGNLVLAGVGGGEHGTRGFVAAYDAQTGKEAWRFWTIPAPGEPGSETWGGGKDITHGGAPTWLTGSYDPELDTIYWPIGNPAKEYEGKDRPGDNLYSDCVVALDPKTGKLKWHFQFTPHDLWDWDATETPVLINAQWEGRERKLLLHGNRNGFFYVLDRTNGKPLLIKQFVEKLTWATGMTPEGRPIFAPNQKPTPQGTLVCPSQDGASNFYSPSYIPATGLFYFHTFEKCSIYQTRDQGDWTPGKAYLGGSQRIAPGKVQHFLRALDIRTGKTVWTLDQPGPAQSWGGTIATVTGLVFFGEENGAMMAADATTGKPLWRFETNQLWKASPMAYMFDGKQYIAAIAGGNVIAFGLPD